MLTKRSQIRNLEDSNSVYRKNNEDLRKRNRELQEQVDQLCLENGSLFGLFRGVRELIDAASGNSNVVSLKKLRDLTGITYMTRK